MANKLLTRQEVCDMIGVGGGTESNRLCTIAYAIQMGAKSWQEEDSNQNRIIWDATGPIIEPDPDPGDEIVKHPVDRTQPAVPITVEIEGTGGGYTEDNCMYYVDGSSGNMHGTNNTYNYSTHQFIFTYKTYTYVSFTFSYNGVPCTLQQYNAKGCTVQVSGNKVTLTNIDWDNFDFIIICFAPNAPRTFYLECDIAN